MNPKSARGGLVLGLGAVLLLTGCVRAGGAVVSSTQGLIDPDEPVAAATPTTAFDQTPSPPPSTDSAVASPALPLLTADEFWIAALGSDPAIITYPSLASLIKDSSAVVLGSIGSVTRGPDYLTKEGVYTVFQASFHVNVDRVLSGSVKSLTPDQVTFVTTLGVDTLATSGAFADAFTRLAGSSPKEQVVLFLVNGDDWAKRFGVPIETPGVDPNLYLLLGGQSFLRNVAGRVEPGPIAGWQQTLGGRAFDEVVDLIEAAAR